MKIEKIKLANNIAILWYWKEWKSTLDFLLKIWINSEKITVLDKEKKSIQKGIRYIYWENYLEDLDKYDIIIKSPWISPYQEKLVKYYGKFITQTSIFFDNKGDLKVIWVTATKWKSTTASLIYECLKEAWLNVKLAGNIWTPVLNEIDILNKINYDFVVYELSSYMLENLEPKCEIAILWNIYKCHLDWHNNSFDTYIKAKTNILTNSKYLLVGSDFPNLKQKNNVQFFWTSWKYTFNNNNFYIDWIEIYKWKILLKWDHNKKNIAWVTWILNIINKNYYKININKILNNILPNFGWLSHRMQNIWTYNKITFIDDWISTTPESTIEAIKTFWNDIDTIFLWWLDYWFTKDSYVLLIDNIIKYKIKNIVLFPDTWLKIFEINNKYNFWDNFKLTVNDFELNILYTDKMFEAIKFTYLNNSKNKICLMSCAAPSYSLWSWYEHKWKDFYDNIINSQNTYK